MKVSYLFIQMRPITSIHRNKVNEVRNYIKNIKGFKKVTIFQRQKNLGLANSIIEGVTDIVNDLWQSHCS
jgi:cell division protein FtsX